jgi:hypothetical protein
LKSTMSCMSPCFFHQTNPHYNHQNHSSKFSSMRKKVFEILFSFHVKGLRQRLLCFKE